MGDKYFGEAKKALLDHYGEQVSFDFETNRCLKFEVAGDLQFDLLFTGDPTQNHCGNPQNYYFPAASHEVDDQLIQAKQKYPIFQALVMLCKHWKNCHKGKYFLVSYYVELLCYRLVRENSQGDFRLKDGFK